MIVFLFGGRCVRRNIINCFVGRDSVLVMIGDGLMATLGMSKNR